MERGRPQQPLGDAPAPVRDLAAALRALRASAGNPPYRSMASTAHFSPATLARAAAGHRLPSRDVVIAYAAACGGDRKEWEQRWLDCAAQVTQTHAGHPPADAKPTHRPDDQPSARLRDIPEQDRSSAPRRLHTRRGTAASVKVMFAAAVLVLGIGAASDTPSNTSPKTQYIPAPNAAISETPGRACDPAGIVAPAPTSTLAPHAQQARIRADFETGFDTNRDGWAWWWPTSYKSLPGDFTTDRAFHGTRSLRVRVPSGVTAAVGTIHLDGLKPASTVTAHIWYSGQGAGRICPFIQTPGAGAIEWIPQPDLQLTTADWPRWYTYSWTVPDSAVFGTGVGVVNSGATDFVILLDAVTW
jgi:hypothetical protein